MRIGEGGHAGKQIDYDKLTAYADDGTKLNLKELITKMKDMISIVTDLP